jgi:hypothetical protein
MDRRRIGQGDFIQFADIIGDESPFKVDLDLAFLDIDLGYLPDIAVVPKLSRCRSRKNYIPSVECLTELM